MAGLSVNGNREGLIALGYLGKLDALDEAVSSCARKEAEHTHNVLNDHA